jgi:hypothetical protein
VGLQSLEGKQYLPGYRSCVVMQIIYRTKVLGPMELAVDAKRPCKVSETQTTWDIEYSAWKFFMQPVRWGTQKLK